MLRLLYQTRGLYANFEQTFGWLDGIARFSLRVQILGYV